MSVDIVGVPFERRPAWGESALGLGNRFQFYGVAPVGVPFADVDVVVGIHVEVVSVQKGFRRLMERSEFSGGVVRLAASWGADHFAGFAVENRHESALA